MGPFSSINHVIEYIAWEPRLGSKSFNTWTELLRLTGSRAILVNGPMEQVIHGSKVDYMRHGDLDVIKWDLDIYT